MLEIGTNLMQTITLVGFFIMAIFVVYFISKEK